MKFPLAVPSINRRILKTLIFTSLSMGPWTVPADFVQAGSKVQCWAAGGTAGVSANTNPGAGGGCAYSESSNLAFVPGAVLQFNIGVATPAPTTAGVPAQSGPTWIGGTSLATSTVGAEGGRGGPSAGGAGGLGGDAANGKGDIRFSGGKGGTGSGGGAGGGGAAGPNGNGADGGSNPGNGGQGNNGFGGLGGLVASGAVAANPGLPGTEFGSYGSGGGSGGRSTINNGFVGAPGGAFGGGGGAARATAVTASGPGFNGLLVITYMGLAPIVSANTAIISGTGAQAFTIPEYNTITFYVWSGGASGCGAAGGIAVPHDGNDSTIAQFGMVAGAGQGGAVAANAVGGLGGIATGGDVNTNGGQGGGGSTATNTTGNGGDAPNAAKGGGLGGVRPGPVTSPGTPGAPFGGGGSSGRNSAYGPGGGSGSLCQKTFNRGDFGAPVPGSTVNLVIGAGGIATTTTYPGGPGADGGARIEWA